jgi:hypothetical protein
MELTILLQLDALSGREKTVHEVALQFRASDGYQRERVQTDLPR